MHLKTDKSTIFVRSLLWVIVAFVATTARAIDSGDNFADRPVIEGTSGQVNGSTVGATREADEPNHAGLSGGGSVWRSWTAPATGPVSFDTLGSAFDTLLAVYIGNALGALTVVASSDDIQWPTNLLSQLSFNAQEGVTYAVAVDGFQGAAGDFTLNWMQDPLPPTEYTLSLNATGNGRVRVNGNLKALPYTESFDTNAQVLVEAVPLGGWLFAGWSGDLAGSTNPVVVKMTGDWTLTSGFEVDPSLNSVSVPWYVDSAGAAQYIPPQDGRVTTLVYLNNLSDVPLDCFIEYYTQEGVFVGPTDANAFSIAAGASLAFRPVADDPATVAGGQEAAAGQAVPNRPVSTDNGNDGRKNGAVVIRFGGDPAMLTGQVQTFSNASGLGAYSTMFTLPSAVSGGGAPAGLCAMSVPWYVDNAGAAQGIPPQDGRATTMIYLHNNRNYEVPCLVEYFTESGVSIGPASENLFSIPPNASLAFRPVADDPATVPGGQEASLGLTVPNRPLGTDNGNDNKKNGSVQIRWLGNPADVQGVVATYSYRDPGGSYASSTTLPPGVVLPPEE